MLSRMGASLAAALDLPDLVARTPSDYVDVAQHAARRKGRLKRLGRLKMRLRRAVRVGTLFNADAWVYWYEVRGPGGSVRSCVTPLWEWGGRAGTPL
jgi:hypothetical protein